MNHIASNVRHDTAPRSPEPYPQDWLTLARSLGEEFRPGAAERDQNRVLPVEQVRRLRETGLVNLLYPAELGGGGASVYEAAHAVFEIARADGSLGAILAFHLYNSLVPLLLDYSGSNDHVARESIANRWQWGNVTQYVNKDFVAEPHAEGGYTITGVKKWNTGTPLAEHTTLLLVHPDRDHYIYTHIPTGREGVAIQQDWDQIGLRGADSSTISFTNVRVYAEEVFNWGHGGVQSSVLPLWTVFGAVFYSAVYLGSAQAAIDAARAYATGRKRQNTLPGAVVTADDVLVQQQFGQIWVKQQAALAYFDQVIGQVQEIWTNRKQSTPEERAEISMKSLALRSHSSETALDITRQIFDFGGGSATSRTLDFDRFWRDARTLTSHDPASLAWKNIGVYAFSGKAHSYPSHFPKQAG